MSTMQDFQNWLSAPHEKPSRYQRSLKRLTDLNRTQVMNVASELTWYLWGADGNSPDQTSVA